MIHGMGFRDGFPCYWGRIPKALEEHGSELFFGFQDANGSIEDNCKALKKSLEKYIADTGAEKVNIIAHSKGGIEARYLISTMGMGRYIASVTTLNTPHKGSKTMDKLIRLPKFLLRGGSAVFDIFMKLGGDRSPRTYRCLEQLTSDFMEGFNAENPDVSDIYYSSYAFKMKNGFSDGLMTIPWLVMKLLNGDGDGMLTPQEVEWGDFHGVYTGTGNRGISHPDEVDLRRKAFSKKTPSNDHEISDITDFYIKLVSELKERGL